MTLGIYTLNAKYLGSCWLGKPHGNSKLVCVDERKRAAGMVRHIVETQRSGGSYKRAGDFTSDFSLADAGNGTWQIGPF